MEDEELQDGVSVSTTLDEGNESSSVIYECVCRSSNRIGSAVRRHQQ